MNPHLNLAQGLIFITPLSFGGFKKEELPQSAVPTQHTRSSRSSTSPKN